MKVTGKDVKIVKSRNNSRKKKYDTYLICQEEEQKQKEQDKLVEQKVKQELEKQHKVLINQNYLRFSNLHITTIQSAPTLKYPLHHK